MRPAVRLPFRGQQRLYTRDRECRAVAFTALAPASDADVFELPDQGVLA